jgi:hypothetical protein
MLPSSYEATDEDRDLSDAPETADEREPARERDPALTASSSTAFAPGKNPNAPLALGKREANVYAAYPTFYETADVTMPIGDVRAMLVISMY